jgi:serine protease AprX
VNPRPRVIAIGGLAAGLAMMTLPAAAAPVASAHQGRMVNAVVVVRPGVHLPLSVAGGHVRAVFSRVGSELVRAPLGSLMKLAGDPRVAGVTPDRSGTVSGLKGKNDEAKDKTKSVFASERLGGDAGGDKTGAGVNVAMLDTGLSDTPALNRASGRVTDGVDVSQLAAGGDAQTSGKFTDGFGHGTFLASLIAGGKVPGSGGHALGVAPAARVVVVKVANDEGQTTLSEVLAGMDWVAAHARAPDGTQMIQVLNVALAVERPTAPAYGADPLTAAVEQVRAAGVLVVAASGNVAGEVGDPGLDPQAATIGAADLSNGKPSVAPFSGSGVVAGVQKPDLVANGVHVLGLLAPDSSIAQQNPQGWQDNGLFRGSGTSEATAVASGVAAAYFSDHPDATPAQAKAALRDAANGDVRDPRAGAGLLSMATKGNGPRSGDSTNSGENTFDANSWQANAWQPGFDWVSLLASSWSASSWSASSWSASSWSASSWSASSWSASSWSASSWSASSWSASSWSASSWSGATWSASSWSSATWSASSWSSYGWGDA